MSTKNTNKYIDFKMLFQDLYNEKESELEKEKYIADHFKQILEFYTKYNNVELIKEECEFNQKLIMFVFYHKTNGIFTTIIFDRILDEFVSAEKETKLKTNTNNLETQSESVNLKTIGDELVPLFPIESNTEPNLIDFYQFKMQDFFMLCTQELNFNTLTSVTKNNIIDIKFSTPYKGKHHYIRIIFNDSIGKLDLCAQINHNIVEHKQIDQYEAIRIISNFKVCI